MIDKKFVDTNIMVYAHDSEAGRKHTIAKQTLSELWDQRTGVLSPQVLADYRPWCTNGGPAEIASAFKLEDIAKISLWDALICAAALKAGAVTSRSTPAELH